MSASIYHRILNLGLRALTLASKFALIFLLARFLEPAELGIYGLLAASVAYSIFLVGLDFYVFTTREIIAAPVESRGAMLKNHSVVSAVAYMVAMPLFLAIFWSGLLPPEYAAFFFGILIVEYLSQEISRLLIALSQPLFASMMLFVRFGAWSLLAVAAMAYTAEARTLYFVLSCWLAGGLAAVLMGSVRVAKLGGFTGWSSPADWVWIRRGLRIVLPFLVATLALRALNTADRYWFEALLGLEALGAYVFFAALAITLMAVLESALFVFAYPLLIIAVKEKRPEQFRRGMSDLLLHVAVLSVAFVAAVLIMTPYLLIWIGRPVYGQYYGLLYWLIGAAVLQALSMVPHYGLYAQGHDRPIIHSHLIALPVFVLATALLQKPLPVYAVPAGLCLAFAVMLAWKIFAFRKLTPQPYQANRIIV